MSGVKELVLSPAVNRSVLIRLPGKYPSSILHNLAIMSHVVKEAAALEQRESDDGTMSSSSKVTVEHIDFAREPFQHSALNFGFLRFTSSSQTNAALNVPKSRLQIVLPQISPLSSSFIQEPKLQEGSEQEQRDSSPLSKVLRDTYKDVSQVDDRVPLEYAGLKDVAPYLGLKLPASIADHDEGDIGTTTSSWSDQPDEIGPVEIVVQRRERSALTASHASGRLESGSGKDASSARAQSAFKAWSGFAKLKQTDGTVEES